VGLERVHSIDRSEHFGPVRLGPQDLRDLAAVFTDLDSRVTLTLPEFRTQFRTAEHRTEDIEDVLAFADADTLSSLSITSGEILLSLHLHSSGTTLDRIGTPRVAADTQTVDQAAEKVRQIVLARQVGRWAALRQRGPGKWLLATVLLVPVLALTVLPTALDLWLTRTASEAVTAGLVWLCFLTVLLLALRPKDLIRLRGRDLPWWERRTGLLALLGVVVAVVIPFVVLALERDRG